MNISKIWEWISNFISKIATNLLSVLPQSPFRTFINNFQAPTYIKWLNWFIPVSDILNILALWLTAITLFYLYSIIMRWIKVIGD